MIKLYSSAIHPRRWIAYVQGEGWVVFPTRENGWAERCSAQGLDPMHLREVPLFRASQTGIPLPGAQASRKAA
jgi:hypothetical protein